jgi:hypothetical protein
VWPSWSPSAAWKRTSTLVETTSTSPARPWHALLAAGPATRGWRDLWLARRLAARAAASIRESTGFPACTPGIAAVSVVVRGWLLDGACAASLVGTGAHPIFCRMRRLLRQASPLRMPGGCAAGAEFGVRGMREGVGAFHWLQAEGYGAYRKLLDQAATTQGAKR